MAAGVRSLGRPGECFFFCAVAPKVFLVAVPQNEVGGSVIHGAL